MRWRLGKRNLLVSDEKKIALKEVQDFVEFVIQTKKIPPWVSLKNIEYFDPGLLAWMALLNQGSSPINIIPPKDVDEYFKLCQLSILLKDKYLKPLTFEFPPKLSQDFSPVFVINKKNFKFLYNGHFSDIWDKFKKLFEDKESQKRFCEVFKSSQKTKKKSSPKAESTPKTEKRSTQKIKKEVILSLLKKIIQGSYKKKKGEKEDSESVLVRYFINRSEKLNINLSIEEKSLLLYFIESLNPLALHRKTVDKLFNSDRWENRPKSLGISGITHKLQSYYENRAMDFLEEYLLPQPPFFIYLFSLCVRNFYNVYTKASKEKRDTDIADIHSLYAFCLDFYLGIRELAKNIVEHAGQGAIVTRVYDEGKCEQFINDIKKYSGVNISWSTNNEFRGIFTSYVIDIGEKGIIKTSIEKLKKMKEGIKEPQSQDEIGKDISSLEKGHITLRHFYDYTQGFKMLHQRIRTAAGIGLMFFSNLLTLNKGLMWVSSPGKGLSQMDSVCMYHKTWYKDYSEELYFEENINPLFPIGTCYLFVLPVPESKEKLRLVTHRQIGEKLQSPASNSIFIEMASSQDKNLEIDKLESITSDRVLIEWPIEIERPIRCDTEVVQKISQKWKEYDNKLKTQLSKGKNPLPIIWLRPKYELDASDVFHILAIVEFVSRVRGIVLSHIDFKVIKNLIRILLIYDKYEANIWSKDCLSLIMPLDPSYPPFIVGGEKYNDWKKLNEQIARFYNNEFWVAELKKEDINA